MINSSVLIRHFPAAIERIGSSTEASLRIASDIKDSCPDIPWKKISAMRNKLMHEYFGVDLNTVWIVLVEDLTPLRTALVDILNRLEA